MPLIMILIFILPR